MSARRALDRSSGVAWRKGRATAISQDTEKKGFGEVISLRFKLPEIFIPKYHETGNSVIRLGAEI